MVFKKYVAWVALLLSLLLTLLVWNDAEQNIAQKRQAQFEKRVSEVSDAVVKRMDLYAQVLRGGVGLFASSESVTRTEFKEYVASLKIEEQYPGIQGIGFALYISPASLDAHLSKIRAEGFSDYAIRPSGPRSEYTSIIYIEPFGLRNQRAFGFDMFSEANRRVAMERARDTNETSVSAKVVLVQEITAKVQSGILMYLPYYKHGMPQNTLAERRANLVGYIYSPFRMNDLMSGILGKKQTSPHSYIDIEIYDGTVRSADSLLYDDDGIAHALGTPPPGSLTQATSIDLYGQTWSLSFTTLPAFHAAFDDNKPLLILLFGTLLSLMLSGLIWMFATQRRRALELADDLTSDLRDSEAILSATIESSNDAIISTDFYENITSWNPAAERMYGYSTEEIVGQPFSILIPSDKAVEETNMLERIRDGHRIEHFETIRIKKDGIVFPVSVGISPISDSSGTIIGVSSMTRDITEQKQAAQNITRLASIVESSNDSITSISLDGVIMSWNPAAERMYGYSAKEIIGQSFSIFVPSVKADEVADIPTKIRDGHRIEHFDTIRARKDGSTFPVSLTLSPIRDSTGAVIGISNITRDMTELKKAEQKFSTIVELSPDAMVMINKTGIITMVNSQTEKLYGYHRDEMLGQPLVFILASSFHAGISGRLERFFGDFQAQPMGVRRELSGRRKNGQEFPMETNLSPIETADGAMMVATIRDITESKQYQDEILRLNSSLLEADNAKNNFIESMNHELRTPLSLIIGYIDLAIEGVDSGAEPELASSLMVMQRNALQLNILIENMMQLSKTNFEYKPLNIATVDVGNILGDVVKSMKLSADNVGVTMTLRLDSPASDFLIDGDTGQLEQVFVNLISNAIKFTPREGKVTIVARGANTDGDYIEVTVTDTGIGIPPDEFPNMFKRFFRASTATQASISGFGIGLSLVHSIIRGHHGTITFDSTVGEGTVFTVTLPTRYVSTR